MHQIQQIMYLIPIVSQIARLSLKNRENAFDTALEFPTGLIPPQKPFILDLLSVETLFSERRNCIPSSQNMFLKNIYGALSEEFKLFDA